ncbi:hypothetical protein [Glaciimonas sp. PAMC28666]|uniref:hypothetical protein n=1 Tax=Glaciimonas sp. PAMC28666 TaxID=2807626 RepID=UPI001962B633|nr:hypothetical protein [Glaciimonas sp. PAMC28666]QRX83543.1 hypothetical protein JQN73_04695 [Glaciimonas sp. PAMC28666]
MSLPLLEVGLIVSKRKLIESTHIGIEAMNHIDSFLDRNNRNNGNNRDQAQGRALAGAPHPTLTLPLRIHDG